VTRWFTSLELMIFLPLSSRGPAEFVPWGETSISSRRNKGFGPQFLKTSPGFTLLEVLVALIVLAMSLGITFQALSQSGRISWKADRYSEAARIAQNLLADTDWVRQAIKDKDRQGELKGENGWRYSVTVEPLTLKMDEEEGPVEIPSMITLRLCLSYGDDREEKSYCLTRWYREGLIGAE
jgi:prepilin-type N-terminal cleavage/methylation domain-containing protein